MSREEPVESSIFTRRITESDPLPGNNAQNAAVKYKMTPSLYEKLSPLFSSGERHAANKQPFPTRRSKTSNAAPQ
jgi:hypothetical protein